MLYITVYNTTKAVYTETGFDPFQLSKLLSDSPHIANYVRSLKVEMISSCVKNRMNLKKRRYPQFCFSFTVWKA